MNIDILQSLEELKTTLELSLSQETVERTIESYKLHLDKTNKLINQLQESGYDQNQIDLYFEQEGRQYGWSFLPNENGRIAEEAFWSLKKKLGYYG